MILFALGGVSAQAQISASQDAVGRDNTSNIISTAASFLLITPDSRAAGLGDAGVATSADINSQHWNASKYIFAEHKNGVSGSYTPWLKSYVDDMFIGYLSGYNKLKRGNQAIGYSLTYFNYGDMTFTDYNGTTLKNFNPKEFALDASYSLKLAENLSGGLTMRYIYSNLTGKATIGSEESHAGHSVAGDISVFYTKNFQTGEKNSTLSLGANISNIGTKMGYTSNNQNFIPTNLKLGVCYKLDIDEYNSISCAFDVNKLLVPTPPVYNATGDSIIAGKDDDVSVPVGIFQSFGDAPDGFKEEIKELSYSIGFEYWYANTFAGRIGYFTEHKDKGGRRYLTFGVGLNIKSFTFDFAYLVTTTQSNPLQNTIRFSLGFYLDNSKK
ncbi:MAG: type IX secretion system outer membrane channel protein PorV [Bacteroidales bacterium]|nr:type IX secretion system outer membrane channel protein PorV [Bacteroidales bacterium]